MTTTKRYIAHFQPQAWVNDYAVDVDAQGEQEWDCTDFLNRETVFQHQIFEDVEDKILDEGTWLDSHDWFQLDPNAPGWVRDYDGPFTITVRYRTEEDAGVPEVSAPEPALVPTAEKLLAAIENHRNEVYSQADPNFCWDIELYQAAGLLPEEFEHPEEDQLSGSIYALRKALEALLAVAEPAGEILCHPPDLVLASSALADAVTAAKRALADHGKAAPCDCRVHGGEPNEELT